ncbi:sodium/potassium-transporting ATPase subunit alpha [Pelomyxa schiedti]|nr:sodium/potassium-transporting ATPase subunit alpha [Pelomyxa schiedti]
MVRMEDLSEGHSGVALTGNNGDPTIEFKGVTVVPTTTAEEKSRKGRRKQNQDQLKKDLDLDVHTIPLKELCERLEVDVSKGLSKGEAELRLQRDGPNSITPPRKTPEIIKFLKQMVGWFSLLLWSGSILSAVGYILDSSDQSNLYLAIVLAAVVTLTGIFSYIQERKSSNVMEKFKDFLPALSKVKRESLIQTVPVAQLVCGDIVFVKAGDKVPADLRVFSCNDCHVDNSSLTGEAEPQPRTENCTSHNPLETENLLFYGTLITAGEAYGIVVLTGDETVIGRIARLATGTASQQTTLQRELNRFIIIISVVAIVLGVVFLAVSFIIDRDIIKNLVFMIGIIVANVPEGLLATVTVALTLTAKRMASKKVLVKTLSTVESLGSTSVICSDKTGTLTQNKMSCVHIWLDNAVYTCETSTTCATFDKYKPSFICLQRVATLCCNATFNPDDYGVVPLNDCRTIGDSSESALIKLCDPITPILAYRHNYLTKFEIPFNSDNKYHVTIHSLDEEADKRSGFLMLMKGAPERVAARCSFIIQEGKEVEFSAELKSSCEAVSQHFASLGERVLGFAQKYLSIEKYPSVESLKDLNVEQESSELVDLSFIGLISLIDPPREGVPEAVAMCKAAGIKVIMVTGDHPITAKAIAHQVGIITGQTAEDIAMKNHTSISEVDPKDVEAVVVQGQEIKSFTRDDWDKVLSYPEIVFARTSPQQKLVIVENNQIRGQVVAVTGDGVNDSPALKKANIGVAMGISGSDVSKEAAHMILLDDNFTSIVNGVQEG